MKYLLIAVISYCLGSLPFSYLIGEKFFGIDIRSKGSGNPGTTNAFRAFGAKAGVFTLILDMLKGAIAVIIGRYLGGQEGALLALLFAPMGHIFSFILKFKGGKGVATTGGALIAVDYRVALVLLVVFLIIFLTSRIVSLASIIAAALATFVVIYFYGFSYFALVVLILALTIIIKHRSNIKRLINKTEKKMF
ncbi:MAG: glycerol-3-phosphate 1-O-acyltransferase PlsY [Anaerococcus sp.]|jgi:glycerol-3-phosphate acyltransferase PlsY|nr:glycerol-3-phosphate 1-O-acyltransferase PlsY [Peptoniphilaceae bacterium]MDY3054829.1 glycerol-3-phosphate 1-O-acyltransferase PlsY [Anaerococcus sp.]